MFWFESRMDNGQSYVNLKTTQSMSMHQKVELVSTPQENLFDMPTALQDAGVHDVHA